MVILRNYQILGKKLAKIMYLNRMIVFDIRLEMRKLLNIALFFVPMVVFCEEVKYTRAATAEDMEGIWKQVGQLGGGVTDLSDPWYSNPQLMMFTKDGYMKSLLVRGDKLPANGVDMIKVAKGVTSYKFLDENGLMELLYANNTKYRVLCTYCERSMATGSKDEGKPKKGDVIMTYIDAATNKELFKRVLRKVE